MTKLIANGDTLEFHSNYSAVKSGLIAELKSRIPYSERRWNADKKVWLIAPKHGKLVCDLVAQYMHEQLTPPIVSIQQQKETRAVKVEYVGTAKDRGNGSIAATGYSAGDWNVIFPVDVLKVWFEPDNQDHTEQQKEKTYYGTLSIKRDASADDIKKSYRRLARQWHPDVCKEPDAHEVFIKIQNAYEVLNDPQSRRKYDAGLKLEESINLGHKTNRDFSFGARDYRPPLRCGYILAEGVESLGRFTISKILAWEDITNERGQTMVSSWKPGSKIFSIDWI